MSVMENDYFYAKSFRRNSPEWFRLERYDYCDLFDENNFSAKRGFFIRRSDRKRSK